jgi:hypothetical protein
VTAPWPPTPAAFLMPVIPGHEEPLAAALAALAALSAGDSPFALLESTHLLRYVVVGEPPAVAGARPVPPLRGRYLLCTAVSNSPVDDFVEELRARCGSEVDSVWTHCVAYPGSRQAPAFRRYLQHNRITTPQRFAAYDATVPQVRDALSLGVRHRALALRTQLVDDPQTLLQAFRGEFGVPGSGVTS